MSNLQTVAADFEAKLQQGLSPELSKTLESVPADQRLALAQLLIPIELKYRLKQAESIDLRKDDSQLPPEILMPLEQSRLGYAEEQTNLITPATQTETPGINPTRSSATRQQIGHYQLLQKLGEGGMGAVWLAEQSQPIRRRVALKLVKCGIDDKQVIARFESERQALSMMNHPNIAQVLDAGSTPDGQPYFVMELVQGIPFSSYCDKNKLSIEERLELFIPVCEAIQHAHQKGIIHRDLKPSNVLVCLMDGKPTPKVIDFGLAKAIQHTTRLTDRTMFTEIGQVVGTLQYMSPEQAEMNQLDIDTRTDVYSLGVMLYELLTGSTPLDRSTLGNQAIFKVLEIIREQDPPLPSFRLSSITNEAASGVSKQRKIDPVKLKHILRGELDWIVMKTLEKDRSRRYASASEIAAELQRFLSGDPVKARPPSRRYLVSKYVRKHRGFVVALVSIFALLGLAVVGTSWGMWRANSEANRARLAEAEATISKTNALAAANDEREARLQSEKRLKQIEISNETLGGIFEDLDIRAIQRGTEKIEAILAKRLIAAGKRLKAESVGDPIVVAKLQGQLGASLVNLGFEKDAIQLLQDCVTTYEGEKGRNDKRTIAAIDNLAVCYEGAGMLEKSLTLAEEAYELAKVTFADDQESLLPIMNNLGTSYQSSGRIDKALPLLEQSLEIVKKVYGEEHAHTLTSLNNLGGLYFAAGKPDKALPYIQQTLKLTKIVLSPNHPNTLATMNNLAALHRALGQYDEAIPLYEETLQLRRELLGEMHPETLISMNNLSAGYRAIGDFARAIPLMSETLQKRIEKLGVDHPDTLLTATNLATLYFTQKQFDLAIPLFEETLKNRKAKLGDQHPDTFKGKVLLAECYLANGKYDQALPMFQEAVDSSKDLLEDFAPLKLSAMNGLACVLFAQNQTDQAQAAMNSVLDLVKAQRNGPGSQATALTSQLIEMSGYLLSVKHFSGARVVLQECIALSNELTPDALTTFYAQTLIGSALIGQASLRKDDEPALSKSLLQEAESNLNVGYEGILQRLEKSPPKLRRKRQLESIERFIALFLAREDEVNRKKWEQEYSRVLDQNL